MMRDPSLPWVDCSSVSATTRLRLFCLPYAGGGSSMFRGWSAVVAPSGIAVCPIQLPGRENRIAHPAYQDIARLIPDLAQVLLPELVQPFAIFGYSMGALIGFELIRYLRLHNYSLPCALIVGAAKAPQEQTTERPLYGLPDAELIDELKKFQGTSQFILDNAELMALLLPMLRSDFKMLETYCYHSQPPLDLPILAMGGQMDATVAVEELMDWAKQTQRFQHQLFSGHHFFINFHRDQALDAVRRFIADLLHDP
jgi:medium-chain acyl-[acyl-carrier-protein] hydrolase